MYQQPQWQWWRWFFGMCMHKLTYINALSMWRYKCNVADVVFYEIQEMPDNNSEITIAVIIINIIVIVIAIRVINVMYNNLCVRSSPHPPNKITNYPPPRENANRYLRSGKRMIFNSNRIEHISHVCISTSFNWLRTRYYASDKCVLCVYIYAHNFAAHYFDMKFSWMLTEILHASMHAYEYFTNLIGFKHWNSLSLRLTL